MPLINKYQFILEICDQEGRVFHRAPVNDFRRCKEDFRFSAFRSGFWENRSREPDLLLEPLWLDEGKSPYCEGVMLHLAENGSPYAKQYGKPLFKYQAYRAYLELAQNRVQEKDEVQAETELHYRIAAFPIDQNGPNGVGGSDGIIITFADHPLPLVRRSLADFPPPATPFSEGEMPVLMAEHVVEEMIDYVMQRKDREQAGFLVGQLCQDPETGAVFLVCNAQLPARNGKGQSAPTESSSITHFQFLPEHFCDVQRIIALRRKDEIVLGWYHSHPWPFVCEKGEQCHCTSIFFSMADVGVMEAAFPAPYQVAMVIGRGSLENMIPAVQMYGWKDGLMVAREYLRFNLIKMRGQCK